VTENNVIRLSAYEFLLAFHSNYDPILHRFCNIARYWSKIADFNLPHLYMVPLFGVIPLEFRQDFWQQKTRVPGLPHLITKVALL